MMLKKRVYCFVVSALTALIGLAEPCFSQTWPQRTVRVIVSNPAGVSIDTIARLFAERLAARWGQAAEIRRFWRIDAL